MKKYILYFIVALVFISCNNDKAVSMNHPKRNINIIQKEVFEGNTESYHELGIIYLDYPAHNFLYWALLMANKNDYPPAYLDVFYCYVTAYAGSIENFKDMDNKSKEFALKYLKIAAKKNVVEAKEILDSLKKEKVID